MKKFSLTFFIFFAFFLFFPPFVQSEERSVTVKPKEKRDLAVLGVTSLGTNFEDAINRTYKGVTLIKWDGAYYRRDIGRKAIPISRKSLDI